MIYISRELGVIVEDDGSSANDEWVFLKLKIEAAKIVAIAYGPGLISFPPSSAAFISN
jgi:hypothetical protein